MKWITWCKDCETVAEDVVCDYHHRCRAVVFIDEGWEL